MTLHCERGGMVAMEQAATIRARRVYSRIGGETTAVREEGESDNFFIFISM
jgi:hypothetical protein